MMRIKALNEEIPDLDDIGENITATQEAQETIAESEYVRAIKLKSQGKKEDSLMLLNELLATQVLSEIPLDKTNEKLWSLRYNCHKNIAFIHEEREEYSDALLNYIMAMQIERGDIFSMHRFGRLALKLNAFELAEFAFEHCLQRNPLHWSAADGLLQTFCHNRNVLGAYELALKIYKNEPESKRALSTLREVGRKFKRLLPVYEKITGPLPSIFESNHDQHDIDIFSTPSNLNDEHRNTTPSGIEQLRIHDLNWLTIGNYIISLYKHLQTTKQSMLFTLNFDDIVHNEKDNSNTEISNFEVSVAEFDNNQQLESNKQQQISVIEGVNTESIGNNDNADAKQFMAPTIPTTSTVNDTTTTGAIDLIPKIDDASENKQPSKTRRRCSDLLFLEQWGWHKSRRYSSRKKNPQDRIEVDTTFNGFLQRILSKFTNTTFEDTWPFAIETTDNTNVPLICQMCLKETSLKEFSSNTELGFNNFIEKLKTNHFDIMDLIYKWLKSMAVFWNIKLPNELIRIYIDIYNLYKKHFDFSSWNQLSTSNLEASYQICLFYLELKISEVQPEDSELIFDWNNTFDHLMFYSGTIYTEFKRENFTKCKIRLINLKFLWNECFQRMEDCVENLLHIINILNEENVEFMLHFPNIKTKCITKPIVQAAMDNLQREISLNKIPKLFDNQNWSNLSEILIKNIPKCDDAKKECEDWIKDFKTQIELLLQSLWSLNLYEECLIWSEKCLHFCVVRYLTEGKQRNSYRQRLWSSGINFIFSYVEAVILNEGFDIVTCLEDMLDRLVQNIIRLLSYLLDTPIDKNNNPIQELDTKRPLVVIHQLILREESYNPVLVQVKNQLEIDDEDELIPNSFLLLFTAHSYLGKRQWCTRDNGELLQYILDTVTPNLKAPLYDACRDSVYAYLEQVTFCLYGYPQKKARSRHIEDHESQTIELTWSRAIQVFNIYKPECLPEFNSYKFESISTDTEQLLLRIITMLPKRLDPTPYINNITLFMSGKSDIQCDEDQLFKLPYQINTLFYLLGDYYFKNRDFSKAIKYFTLDLTCNISRYDSWAGIALSKASKIETKLNSLDPLEYSALLSECEDIIRCFERCISLNRNQTLLWIEYGSFAYTIHSFCSRHLKHSSENLSIEQFAYLEEKKDKMLNVALHCFNFAHDLQNMSIDPIDENDDVHDEKWLSQYMLGKIAEKRKEQPRIYLNYYMRASNFLYENNATYPIKINHSNPTTLSVEALEIFYRINSSMLKFLEHEKSISRQNGDYFKKILDELSRSPFIYNKAKIDGNSLNALKRKISENCEQISNIPKKIVKQLHQDQESSLKTVPVDVTKNPQDNLTTIKRHKNEASSKTLSRRESQESGATVTTVSVTTSPTSSTDTSDSSSSDSDTESENTSENDSKKIKNSNYNTAELDVLYRNIIQNLEECATRFPEHYKSLYRLMYHYMNATIQYQDLKRTEELLLGQYKTNLGNQINGLFSDRKNNNLFNGIWRIPSSEIDRPGSFAAHLTKCVSILIQFLMKSENHKLLVDVGLQLYKTPDNDKRYIKDNERVELYQQTLIFSANIMGEILKKNMNQRDDTQLINLLIDINKIHKKCIKYMNQKVSMFTQLMIDVYKFFVKDKVDYIPENANFLDLAIKLCHQEIAYRKTMEKSNSGLQISESFTGGSFANGKNENMVRIIPIPGLLQRSRARFSKNNTGGVDINTSETQQIVTQPPITMGGEKQLLMSESRNVNVTNPLNMLPLFGASIAMQKNDVEFQKIIENYCKQLLNESQVDQLTVAPALTRPMSFPETCPMTLPNETVTSFTNVVSQHVKNYQDSLNLQQSNLQQLNSDRVNAVEDRTMIPLDGLPQVSVHLLPTQQKQRMNSDSKSNISVTLSAQPSFNELPQCSVVPKIISHTFPDVSKVATNFYNQPHIDANTSSQSTNRTEFTSTSFATTSSTSTSSPSLTVNQAQLLSTYSDLLISSSIMQRHYPPLATSSQSTNLSLTQHTSIYTTNKTTSVTSTSNAQQLETNAFTGTSSSSSNSRQRQTTRISMHQSQPTIGLLSNQTSPIKTLQEKLAERQKANQINESKLPTQKRNVNEEKTKTDIIILD